MLYAEKLSTMATSVLDGETFVEAMKCGPIGHNKRVVLGSAFLGLYGGLVAQSGTKEGHAIDGEALPRQLAIGLTPTRAFVFGVGSMTGKAQLPPLRVVSRDQIVGIASAPARTLGRKQTHIWVRMADGNTLELETMFGFAGDGQLIVEDLLAAGVAEIPNPAPMGRSWGL